MYNAHCSIIFQIVANKYILHGEYGGGGGGGGGGVEGRGSNWILPPTSAKLEIKYS